MREQNPVAYREDGAVLFDTTKMVLDHAYPFEFDGEDCMAVLARDGALNVYRVIEPPEFVPHDCAICGKGTYYIYTPTEVRCAGCTNLESNCSCGVEVNS